MDCPAFLTELSRAPCVERLRGVGMHCGCEYTHFPLFAGLAPYSRFQHSVRCACIVWHFTGRKEEAAAALLHDVATPVFAHTVDFLRGDYLKQEATEQGTQDIIRNDRFLCETLEKHAIAVDAVTDYHLYPVADNDSPKLSADRLEYTLGNLEHYGFATSAQCRAWFDDLRVCTVDGQEEICFQSEQAAESFALATLGCSKVYVSKEDRYAMQMLSEVLQSALTLEVLTMRDLYATEEEVIARMKAHPVLREKWKEFCALHEILSGEDAPKELRRVIPAKKRRIDPYVMGKGRVSALSEPFRRATEAFLKESQEEWICAR